MSAPHRICDECETVAHCSRNGCIPKQPAPDRLSLVVAAHVAEATPYVRLRGPMAGSVGDFRREVARWVLRLRVDAWVARRGLFA